MEMFFDLQRFKEIENRTPNIVVSGTSDDDTIENYSAEGVTINAGDGDDSIKNYGSLTAVNGGDGDDDIYNFSSQVTITGGAGKDSIENWEGSSVSIDGGAGKDYIENYESDAVSIYGGDDNDKIDNSDSSNATINGGKGDDSIDLGYAQNTSNVIVYKSGDGNDTIYGYNPSDIISLAGGSITSWSIKSDYEDYSNSLVLKVGTGSLTIYNAVSAKVNDSIINPLSTEGTWANDTITNFKSNVTINAQSGNDEIYNGGSKVLINVGDGYSKYVYNYGANTTINGGAGENCIYNYSSGDSVTINTGASGDAIGNHASNVLINSGDGNDRITVGSSSDNENVTVNAGAGNDNITNYYGSTNVSINGGSGDDYIDNWSGGDSVTIDGGAGDDYIKNSGDSISIDGGDGDDDIYNMGDNVTISGGIGNDLISLYSDSYSDDYYNNVIVYNNGDGNDTIEGFDANDTLQISGSYSTAKSGSNVIVTVGKGKITLVDAGDLSTVNITGAKAPAPAPVTTNSWTISGTTAKYGTSSKTLVTVTGVKSLDGISLSGKKITVSKAALGTSKVTVSDGYTLALAKDVAKPKSTAAAWSYKNKVATYKSASTTAGYTLASNGKSITYSKAKTASTLATINGVTSAKGISVKGKVITIPKSIVSSKTVTTNGNGYEFSLAKGDYAKATIKGGANKDAITSNGSNLSIVVGTANDTVKVTGSKNTITGGKGNDLVSLSSAAKNNVIAYTSGDGNDSIYGFDANDTLKIAKSTAKVTTSGNDVVFTVGKGKITVKDAKNKTIAYSDAGGTKTYSTVSAEPYKLNSANTAITLLSSYSDKNFDAANFDEKIVTINAAAVTRNISITGNANANKIIGGSGNDTLEGDLKNDSLTGGKGADVFVYYDGSGNDVITDYSEEDKIYVATGTISNVSKSGIKDVVLTVGTGKIVVKNAIKKGITYFDENDFEHDYKNGETVVINGNVAKISENYWKDSFKVDSFAKNIKTINASAVTKALSITGNKIANSIVGSIEDDYIDAGAGNDTIFGGDGNDTLIGGKGADTLQGSAGKDVFVYSSGDGNDLIVDYRQSEDIIWIKSGTIGDAYVNETDVILRVDSGRITVKDGKDKVITIKDKDGKQTTQSYAEKNPSDSVWFLADDDDFAKDNELGAIVQSNSADYSFMNTSTKLAKENDLITYAAKK